MTLKIEEFDVNYITAVGGKSVNGLKLANFRYKNSDKAAFIMYYLGGGEGFLGGYKNFQDEIGGDWKFSNDVKFSLDPC